MTFDGKKENWTMWSEKFLAKATLKGYEDILNGKIDVPKDDEEKTTEEQKKATKLNKLAYNELMLSCTDKKSFAIVKAAKISKYKSGNAKFAWDNLKTKFEPNTGAELVDINQDYMNLRMETGSDPEDFITELEELKEKMAEEPFNEIISDRSFMIQVLNTLSNEYDNLIETMEKELGEGTLTIDEIKTRTRAKYKRMRKTQDVKDNAIALYAENNQTNSASNYNNNNNKYKNRYKNKSFKGTCRICGKYGHKAADCWENTKRGNNNGNYKFKGKCNYCGIFGHKERDCRKKKRDQENRMGSANIAENEETVLICHDDQDYCCIIPHVRGKCTNENVQNINEDMTYAYELENTVTNNEEEKDHYVMIEDNKFSDNVKRKLQLHRRAWQILQRLRPI